MQDETWLRTRRNVVLAFWGTVLLGIPCWYITTQVSRATLPSIPVFEEIRPTIPIAVVGRFPASAHKVATGLNLLQDVHHFVNASVDDNDAYSIHWRESDTFRSGIKAGTREWHLSTSAEQAANLEESIMAYTLKLFKDEAKTIDALSHPGATRQPDLRVVKYSPSYEIVFSLLNGGGGEQSIQDWNIEASLSKQLDPLLSDLEVLSTFSLESQIQFHADLTFQPSYDEATGNHILQSSDLKNFINSAEWNLATAQGQGKPLNFILYVPKPQHRPLVIQHDGQILPSNSFVLPQFGSIIIHNPSSSGSKVLDEKTLDSLLSKSTLHLLTLLGVPDVPEAFGDATRWRLDGLLRQRLVETILSAQETLHSIPKVVNQIPNMHVPAHVATLISDSLDSLARSRAFMDAGKIREALRHSRDAVRYAEEAFFDEKMVSLLYFPDEHKYGVYMPLFGPLLLPLVMAGLRELKAFKKGKKRSKSKQS